MNESKKSTLKKKNLNKNHKLTKTNVAFSKGKGSFTEKKLQYQQKQFCFALQALKTKRKKKVEKTTAEKQKLSWNNK